MTSAEMLAAMNALIDRWVADPDTTEEGRRADVVALCDEIDHRRDRAEEDESMTQIEDVARLIYHDRDKHGEVIIECSRGQECRKMISLGGGERVPYWVYTVPDKGETEADTLQRLALWGGFAPDADGQWQCSACVKAEMEAVTDEH